MCWWEQEVEMSLLPPSKFVFAHAHDIALMHLQNVGGKVSSSPHTHPSFPVEDLPPRRTACDVSFSRNHYLRVAHSEVLQAFQ